MSDRYLKCSKEYISQYRESADDPEQNAVGRAGGDGDGGLALCAERAELSHLRLPLRLRLRALLGLLAPMVPVRFVGAVENVEPTDVAVAAVEPGRGEVVVTARRGPGKGSGQGSGQVSGEGKGRHLSWWKSWKSGCSSKPAIQGSL